MREHSRIFEVTKLQLQLMNKKNKYFLSENNIPFQDFFHFGLSADCAVFGYHNGEVRVLLIERDAEPFKGLWALPGDLVGLHEDLDEAAEKILKNLTGLENIFMEQFHSFATVDRHPAGRVTTVGYYSLVKSDNHEPAASSWAKSTQWFNINNLPKLAFDHECILDKGIRTLQRRVLYRPVGFELLPEKFTLAELQDLYEALLGTSFDKPNFRKKILSMDLLVQLKEVQTNVSHRPAKLFKFDETRYRQLRKEGFAFDLSVKSA
jgi:8-oxo-dGTP diphosphatase